MRLGARSMFGRAVGCALSFCLVTGPVLAGAGPAFAEEAVAESQTSTATASAETSPTVVREDVTKRTENSKHFLLSDGSYRAKVGSGPLHYRKNEGWADIDPRLLPGDEIGEYSSAGLPATVTVGAQTSDSAPVALSGEDWSVGIDMLGATELAKVVIGDRATYLNVAPETDLAYEALADGIKETLVLASADAPTNFSFRVDLEGLSAVSDFSGGVLLQRADGASSGFSLSRLLVTDSSVDEYGRAAVCEEAVMSVESVPGGLIVHYSIPQEWMRDPARLYPVIVDPTITSGVSTYVYQYTPGVSYGTATRLNVGKVSTGVLNSYTYWNLADANLPAQANILNADAWFWLVYAYTGATEKLGRITSAWNESTTYSTRPSNALLTTQYVSGSNKWVAWGVDDTVRDWFYDRSTNFGLALTQDTVMESRHEYASDDEGYAGHRPMLSIDYEIPTVSVSGYASSYRIGDTITATVRVNTAHPSRVREVRLLPNMSSEPQWRGYFGYFAYDPGSTWNSSPAPGGGYFGYRDPTYGGDKVTELVSQWTTSNGTGYKDVTFKWTIEDDYGDIQDNDLETFFQMGTASVGDRSYGWTNHDTNIDILPAPVIDASAATTASNWFREVDRNSDLRADNANDTNGQGRGDVTLSWSPSELADGYEIHLFDGSEYRKVGETLGNASTSWSSAGAGVFPKDSEIATQTDDCWTQDPFYRSHSPADATREAMVATTDADGTGALVVTDGSYLYTRRYASGPGPTAWTKYGSGLAGTVQGKNYGTLGPNLTAKLARSAFYRDGFIYNGYATSATTLEGIPKSAAPGEAGISVLTLSAPMLDRRDGSVITGQSSEVMLAWDGDRLFSVATGDPKYGSFKVRVYESNGAFSDHTITGPPHPIDAVLTDGSNLYLVDGQAGSGQVTRVSTRTWTVTGRWNPDFENNQLGGTYDPANNVFWLGATGKCAISRFAGPGLDLRDSAADLYRATDGESYDARSDYAWRVVPFSEQGTLPVMDNTIVNTALADRTVGVNDEPRHTTYDLGEMAGHTANVVLDERSLELSTIDLSIDSFGPGAALSRTYDSSATTGTLAPGWFFNYESSLETSGSFAIYTDKSGEQHRFVSDNGIWHAPLGFRGTLEADGQAYEIEMQDQTVMRFENGLLVSETDRIGNATTYARSTDHVIITAANGHIIDVEIANSIPQSATYTAPGASAPREVVYSCSDTSTLDVTYFPGQSEGYRVRYGYVDSEIASITVLDDDGTQEQFAGSQATWGFAYSSGALSGVTYPEHSAGADSALSIQYAATPSGEVTATLARTGVSVKGVNNATVTEWRIVSPTGTLARSYDPTDTAAPGAYWTYTYTPDGEPFQEISPTGKKLSRIYDVSGNVIYDFDELGHRNAYRYDEHDRMIRHTDPLGCTMHNAYDAVGNLASQERQLNATDREKTEYEYDDFGRTTLERRRIAGDEWAVTRYAYHEDWSAAQATHKDGVQLHRNATPQTITTTVSFDAWGNTVTQTDGLGVTTTQDGYGDLGLRVLESEDASGVITHTSYDLLGNTVETWRSAPGTSVKADWKTSIIDVFGRTRSETSWLHDGSSATVQSTQVRTHDALGREVASDDNLVDGEPSETQYDARGNVIRQWPEGLAAHTDANATVSHYDEYGQLTKSYSPGATNPTTCAYNADGTTARVDSPDGTWTAYSYDNAGNQITATTQDGTTATRYDIGGRTCASTSADGVTATHVFDLLSREVTVTGGGNDNASTNVYNHVGQVLVATDADGIVTETVYDAAGRTIANSVAGKATTTVYDATGKTLLATDPDGKELRYRHDSFGRVIEEIHTTGAGVVRHTEATTDSLGRIISTADVRTGVQRAFNYPTAPGEGTSVAVSYAGITTTVTADAAGRELSRASRLPFGTFARTVAQRDSAERETAWSVGSLSFGRTLRAEDGKLTGLTVGSDTLSYTYDASARKASDEGTLPMAGSTAASYEYTAMGRLATDTVTGALATYQFDAAGNLATETAGALATIYTYGAGSRLGTMTVGPQVTTYGWDTAHGWRTEARASGEASVTYTYTGTGRLASYTDPNRAVSATYEYDAAGQRTRSVVTSGSVTTETRYTYEGLSLLSLTATETSGSSVSTYTVSYLFDASGSPYAGLYASGEATAVPFVAVTTDRGDIVELRDSCGAAFAAYRYDAWGSPLSVASSATVSIDTTCAAAIALRQPLRYAGYVWDEHSGCYYLSARTYEPATRQFLTKDPAKADGEESAYQYCGGDPVGKVDPSGEWSVYRCWHVQRNLNKDTARSIAFSMLTAVGYAVAKGFVPSTAVTPVGGSVYVVSALVKSIKSAPLKGDIVYFERSDYAYWAPGYIHRNVTHQVLLRIRHWRKKNGYWNLQKTYSTGVALKRWPRLANSRHIKLTAPKWVCVYR